MCASGASAMIRRVARDAVHVRHREVHEDHVGPRRTGLLDGPPRRRRRRHDVDAVGVLEQAGEALAHDRVVVAEQHADVAAGGSIRAERYAEPAGEIEVVRPKSDVISTVSGRCSALWESWSRFRAHFRPRLIASLLRSRERPPSLLQRRAWSSASDARLDDGRARRAAARRHVRPLLPLAGGFAARVPATGLPALRLAASVAV